MSSKSLSSAGGTRHSNLRGFMSYAVLQVRRELLALL